MKIQDANLIINPFKVWIIFICSIYSKGFKTKDDNNYDTSNLLSSSRVNVSSKVFLFIYSLNSH
jgi:hypothetical protein